MKDEKSELEYFIGVGLARKDEEFFTKLRLNLQENKRPLSSPPHVTLLPPFRERNEYLLISNLRKWSKQQKTFQVLFKKLAVYHHLKYDTLVLEPDKGEGLKNLKRSLDRQLVWPTKLIFSFRPHLTLVNKVSHQRIRGLKEKVSLFNLCHLLVVDNIVVYRRLVGQPWSEYQRLKFVG